MVNTADGVEEGPTSMSYLRSLNGVENITAVAHRLNSFFLKKWRPSLDYHAFSWPFN